MLKNIFFSSKIISFLVSSPLLLHIFIVKVKLINKKARLTIYIILIKKNIIIISITKLVLLSYIIKNYIIKNNIIKIL